MSQIDLVQGWTSPVDFRLDADGVAVDLSGMTVTLVLSTNNGELVSLGGSTSLLDATGGQVRYTPSTGGGDFVKGSFRGRWQVVDGDSKVVYFPNGEADTWNVRQP